MHHYRCVASAWHEGAGVMKSPGFTNWGGKLFPKGAFLTCSLMGCGHIEWYWDRLSPPPQFQYVSCSVCTIVRVLDENEKHNLPEEG